MKIILDKAKCIGCGTCWSLCDKLFEQGGDGKSNLIDGSDSKNEQEKEITDVGCAKSAVDTCPVQCIKIK